MAAPLIALIAIGSNSGDSPRIVREAMRQLERFSEQPLQKSSLWETSPVDCPPGSPKFINAAVALIPQPDETPESLLRKLQELEKEFGRRAKQVLNEPRSLDLDLIAFATEVRATPELALPHPRAHQRRFVLQPLSEIAPDFIMPGQTRTISDLLASLESDERLERLA
jgi:2-amino-4-hydroxy-6-hydroxymethyldihydropteridine diphosphokinase